MSFSLPDLIKSINIELLLDFSILYPNQNHIVIQIQIRKINAIFAWNSMWFENADRLSETGNENSIDRDFVMQTDRF